jgi:uncharacterized protein (TIGR02452 family)
MEPMGKYQAIAAANEAIIRDGGYTTAEGIRVELAPQVAAAVRGTRSYDPEQTARLLHDAAHGATAGAPLSRRRDSTRFEVTGESSSDAAQRLVQDEHGEGVAVLTFASARNPGGGYLGGARSQEEDLCRVSALYTTLRQAPDYYAAHRADRDTRYSHRVIFSPDVPVYRDHRLEPLASPFTVSFLTSPAPNAGALRRQLGAEPAGLAELITERAARVLAVATHHGMRTLVLGAWGCGVFRNDPADVAKAFRTHLTDGGVFADRFERVVFAVLDRTPGGPIREVFRRAFTPVVDPAVARTT